MGRRKPAKRKFDTLLTVSEMMDYLAIGKNMAYELIHSKTIPSIVLGRSYKVLKSDLDAFIQNELEKQN